MKSGTGQETGRNGFLTPPRVAEWLLSRICWEADQELMVESMREEFAYRSQSRSLAFARRWYWMHLLRSVGPSAGFEVKWRMVMFKNYLKIALRKMNRQKIYALINVLGLAIGMTGALFILIWVRDELSYDRFHENGDRIYRISQQFNYENFKVHQANTPAILAATLMDESPETERVTRVRGATDEEYLVTVDGVKFNQKGVGIADAQFFQMFSFPLVHGDAATALAEPNTAAISKETAVKYFGTPDAVGRTVTVFERDYLVSAVFETMPENAHFHLHVLRSFASFERYQRVNWGMNSFKTYVLLKEGIPREAMQSRLDDIIKNHMFESPQLYDEVIARGDFTRMPLQPLTGIHLNSNLLWEFEPNGNGTYVQFFTVIGVFILLIAAINYMNLSTARSAGRAREVGIRKTVGSTRSLLVRQFLVESVFTTLMALVLALALMAVLMPSFRNLVGKPWLVLPFIQSPLLLLPMIGAAVLIGLGAGIYPSLFLSSFKPASVLGGKLSRGLKGARMRNGLVVFQFALSILLLVSTLVVQKQMTYIRSQKLGYDQEQVVVLETFGELEPNRDLLRERLLADPAVVSVSASSTVPGKDFNNIGMGLEGGDHSYGTNFMWMDEDYLDVMKMEMAQGRFFSREIPTDAQACILNESKAAELGGGDLIGKRMMIWVGGEGNQPFHIIGIIKDFHYESFHEVVKPMVFARLYGQCPWSEAYLSIRVQTRNMQQVMRHIRQCWTEVVPDMPMESSFLDVIYEEQYHNEARTGSIFSLFTLFAIFVACLGLLGLASFAVEQRTKEIGIRKVLGASVRQLVLLLSGEFARWVALANLAAWPAAWFLMTRWLQNFAYRTSLGVWPFVLSALIMLGVTGVTVGYHALRSATSKPVDALRYE